MYLRSLDIDGLKLLHKFQLDFTRGGEPRMWTVIVGRNGLCKTSILRAIAVAASGDRAANELSSGWRASLGDRRRRSTMVIRAEFGLTDQVHDVPDRPLWATLYLQPGERSFRASSRFELTEAEQTEAYEDQVEYARLAKQPKGMLAKEEPKREPKASDLDGVPGILFEGFDAEPLETARQQERSHWFVAGYGVGRSLPSSHRRDDDNDRILARCRSLFDGGSLIATDFADHLEERFGQAASRCYFAALRHVVLSQARLMPGVRDIGMRATSIESFTTGPSFDIETGEATVSVPSTWLGHGYQTTLAWLADVLGHIVWDHFASDGPAPQQLAPADMQGLVLIDELDLHLHPSWQVGLIPALKQTFPKLQFIVTTHSPMLLAGLEGDEIVMLDQDPRSGDITKHSDPRPAKLMTGTELLARYFNIDRLYPVNLSKEMFQYGRLASDPERTDAEEAEVQRIYRELQQAGVAPDWEPVPRRVG